MVQFLTLFLGLVVGELPVEVAVGDEVASVELLVDGSPVVRYTGPPWTIPLDLGPELTPHELVAVAYDDRNRELSRDRQWINLPRSPAQLGLILGPKSDDDASVGRSVRVSWESSVGSEPIAVRVLLDGRELTVDDPRRFTLPPVDESVVHVLAVELELAEDVTARGHATFGGASVDEVATDLTAIPIRRRGRRVPEPDAAAMEGWFRTGERSLEVVAVDRDDPELVLVVGQDAQELLQTSRGVLRPTRRRLDIPTNLQVRLVSTEPESRKGVHLSFSLFPNVLREEIDADLLEVLATFDPLQPRQRLNPSAAVAAAGLQAFSEGRPRAVVFLRGNSVGSNGSLHPRSVRSYLEDLGVPLFVWDQFPDSPDEGWAPTRFVGSQGSLIAAYQEVRRELENQRIVWLQGRHLPQEIRLDPAVEGWSLAGRP